MLFVGAVEKIVIYSKFYFWSTAFGCSWSSFSCAELAKTEMDPENGLYESEEYCWRFFTVKKTSVLQGQKVQSLTEFQSGFDWFSIFPIDSII